jgi:hypothetical protein
MAILTVITGSSLNCGRATGIPTDSETAANEVQTLPFEQESHPAGVPSTASLLPAASRLPEGTPITIRLRTPVSSDHSLPGDVFEGALDDSIVINGQLAVSRGAPATGRLLAAKGSAGKLRSFGYLRIALTSLMIDGKRVPIETSSVFAKAGARSRGEQFRTTGNEAAADSTPGKNEVSFNAERRLTFRLAQGVELR